MHTLQANVLSPAAFGCGVFPIHRRDTSNVVGFDSILLGHNFDHRVLRRESTADSELGEFARLHWRGVHPHVLSHFAPALYLTIGLDEIILKRLAIRCRKPAFSPLDMIPWDPWIVESDFVDCGDERFAVSHRRQGGRNDVGPGRPLYRGAILIQSIHGPAS